MKRAAPWLIAVMHAALLLGMLARKPFEPYPGPRPEDPFSLSGSGWHMSTSMMVAGRDIHHDDLGLALLVADLPVILVTTLAELAVDDLVSPMAASYVLAGAWLLGGSLWWFLVTRLVLRSFRKTPVQIVA